MTPTKISLCSLWRDVMVSGFNHITVEAKFETNIVFPLTITVPQIDLKRMLSNKKPIILDLTIYKKESPDLPYVITRTIETLNYACQYGEEYFASGISLGLLNPAYILLGYNESNVPYIEISLF